MHGHSWDPHAELMVSAALIQQTISWVFPGSSYLPWTLFSLKHRCSKFTFTWQTTPGCCGTGIYKNWPVRHKKKTRRLAATSFSQALGLQDGDSQIYPFRFVSNYAVTTTRWMSIMTTKASNLSIISFIVRSSKCKLVNQARKHSLLTFFTMKKVKV